MSKLIQNPNQCHLGGCCYWIESGASNIIEGERERERERESTIIKDNLAAQFLLLSLQI